MSVVERWIGFLSAKRWRELILIPNQKQYAKSFFLIGGGGEKHILCAINKMET